MRLGSGKIFGDVSMKQMDATILVDNEEVSAGTNERRRHELHKRGMVLTERNRTGDHRIWQD
jgi:hypothetical protein